jgi:hypothetical protein
MPLRTVLLNSWSVIEDCHVGFVKSGPEAPSPVEP